jgi:hypothetical protein
VRRKAIGVGAGAWLDDLPLLVASLEQECDPEVVFGLCEGAVRIDELESVPIMREDPVDLLDGDPRDRARWLAKRTGLDVTSIWDWGVVERVSTGLLGTKVGLQPVARQMLAAADIVCRRMDTAPT